MEKGNKKITFPKFIPVEQKTLSQILAWKEEKETIEKLKNETKEFVTNSLQDATTNTKTANKIKTWVSQDKNRIQDTPLITRYIPSVKKNPIQTIYSSSRGASPLKTMRPLL